MLQPGAGESGKSTILKQMKMIYAEGFTAEDRKSWRVVIFTNLVHAFQVILSAMEEQGVTYEDPANNVSSTLHIGGHETEAEIMTQYSATRVSSHRIQRSTNNHLSPPIASKPSRFYGTIGASSQPSTEEMSTRFTTILASTSDHNIVSIWGITANLHPATSKTSTAYLRKITSQQTKTSCAHDCVPLESAKRRSTSGNYATRCSTWADSDPSERSGSTFSITCKSCSSSPRLADTIKCLSRIETG